MFMSFSLLFIRVTLTTGDGTLIIETNGTEEVYDPALPKTVNPFLAYTPNDTVSSVGWWWILSVYIILKHEFVFDKIDKIVLCKLWSTWGSSNVSIYCGKW